VANLLTHSLFALALYSSGWSLLRGEPLTGYAFLAAVVALLPDVDLRPDETRSPLGHSLGYAILWGLLSLSALTLLSSASLVPSAAVLPAAFAILVGLGSHLLLDGIVEPGVMSLPSHSDMWRKLPFLIRHRHAPRLELSVSAGSIATLLALLAVY
jgi:hypothetical protein